MLANLAVHMYRGPTFFGSNDFDGARERERWLTLDIYYYQFYLVEACGQEGRAGQKLGRRKFDQLAGLPSGLTGLEKLPCRLSSSGVSSIRASAMARYFFSLGVMGRR